LLLGCFGRHVEPLCDFEIGTSVELWRQTVEELLADENLRKEMLENEEVYIQTKKYIEEKAKEIGYVYPDEIIFRKDE